MKIKLIKKKNFFICDQSDNGNIFYGNKFIKNNYIKHLKKKNIISLGSKYSNHCLSLSYLSKSLNLKFVFLLVDKESKKLQLNNYKNVKYAKKFGAKVIHITGPNIFHKVDLQKKKYKNFRWIPSGGHTKAAIKEYSKSAYNFLKNNLSLIKKIKWILITVGSGTSLIGFLKAIIKLKLNIKIIGVTVSKSKKDVLNISRRYVNKKYIKNLIIIDKYKNFYGKKISGDSKLIKKFKKENKMLIDPIYNVRAIRYLYSKKLTGGLFINTGGISNL